MIRGSPSTTWVSFEKACMLSFVRIFARFCSSTSALRVDQRSDLLDDLLGVLVRVQTSRLRISANRRIEVR